jgi:hypothetical protein
MSEGVVAKFTVVYTLHHYKIKNGEHYVKRG